MKKILTYLTLILIFLSTSCNLLEDKEQKAIAICQESKVQLQTENIFGSLAFNLIGLDSESTWIDFANIIAQKDPNTEYKWAAMESEYESIYIVSFTDEKGWGYKWEVNLDQQIVKNINLNEYLARKYGFSRMSGSEEFKIKNIQKDTLRIIGRSKKEVIYEFRGTVINNTEKSIIDAEIGGELKLIFEEKTVSETSNSDYGFTRKVSKMRPWRPGEEREFKLRTSGIEIIYADYIPPYALFEISLNAQDPIGYDFDENIAEYDLVEKWSRLIEKD